LSAPTLVDFDIRAIKVPIVHAIEPELHVAGADAPIPAVEICSDRSAAGYHLRLTL
jgi:hypothetical protein